MSTPWNGIPDKMETSGWHWLGLNDLMVPYYWNGETKRWDNVGFLAGMLMPEFEYLGPCTPPITRCRDGSKRVAVSARIIRDHDQVGVTMSDGSTHYLDGYYWKDGQPVIDIVGKTIPEIDAAAKQYRKPAPEGDAE